jgi:cellulose synthase/poly-beta-1,6-N-acetylglucosamine synthase-like glycosyltransferase
MKVSIIIPAHNESNFISATLEAVFRLDYPDFEVIVVDNNCTDDTATKVTAFPTVKLLHESRRGTQFARECGRQAATGELIANLDADCLPPPDWLKRAGRYFSNPKVVAVTGPYQYYDRGRWFEFWTTLSQKIVYNWLSKVNYHLFRRGLVMVGGNVVMRATALEKIGGYDTSFIFYGDDTELAKQLATVGKVLYKNDVIVRSSARRFKELGAWRLAWRYIINYLWVTFFSRPFHQSTSNSK